MIYCTSLLFISVMSYCVACAIDNIAFTMVTFIVQGKIRKATIDGDIKTLRDLLDHYPDKVNITDWVCNHSKVHVVVNVHTQ